MSCNCKSKENHPCQNGGECQCGGSCKKQDFLNATGQYEEHNNAAGSLDEFKDGGEDKNKLVYRIVMLAFVVGLTYMIYTKIK